MFELWLNPSHHCGSSHVGEVDVAAQPLHKAFQNGAQKRRSRYASTTNVMG